MDTSSRQGDGDGLKSGCHEVGDVAEGCEQPTAQHLDADLIKQLGDLRVLG